jgi:uncharacterized protein (TIRG00374 family)
MEQRKPVKMTGALLTAGLVLLAVLGIYTALDRSGGSLSDLARASLPAVLGVLAATAVTYAVMSERFRVLSGLTGIFQPARLLHELAFASNILGRVVVGGGMASNVLRVVSLRRHNVPVADTVAVSVAHGYVNFAGVGLALAVAIACIAFVASVTGAQVVGAMVSLLLLVILTALVGWALVDGGARRKVAGKVAQAAGFVARRDFSDLADRFDVVVEDLLRAVRRDPRLAWRVAVMAAVENAAATVALWFAFGAFGVWLTPWEALAIFGLSTAAGAVSMLPGGLGVQDGSITGVAMILGVQAEAALMAALLFRVGHFFLPFAVSLMLYRRLLREVEGAEGTEAAGAGMYGVGRGYAAEGMPAVVYAEELTLDEAAGGVPDRESTLTYAYDRPALVEHGALGATAAYIPSIDSPRDGPGGTLQG